MKHILKNYLRIMSIELDDLREDIKFLIGECKLKRDEDKITNYVYLENIALYNNELHALDAFEKIIARTEAGEFGTLEELIDFLKKEFVEKARTSGYARVIHLLVDRKIQKVAKYICQ